MRMELLFVTGIEDIPYFFFSAFLFIPSRIVVFDFRLSSTAQKYVKQKIIDDFKTALLCLVNSS